MFRIALKMLVGDRVKYVGLLFGIAFTSFLVTFAASYFCGFMTRGFSLISDTAADIWVMDPSVSSAEQTTNLPDSTLARVRSVEGVASAVPLALGSADVRFPDGRMQPFQIIGVDGVTLTGIPPIAGGAPATILRAPEMAIVDPGGSEGKLETPSLSADQWPFQSTQSLHPTRPLMRGDELLVNDKRVRVAGVGEARPRFPPRPLLYTTFANANRIMLPERRRLTFVLVHAASDAVPAELAQRIAQRTGLRARTADDFKIDTVRWYLANSEDVGDMTAMLILAITVGFGVTGVMLYMFTFESLKHYAVLKAMGATPGLLIAMILTQGSLCALIGSGLGFGVCAIVGEAAARVADYPFRLMWFNPLAGGLMVVVVSLAAALISARPVLKLDPAMVFAGR
jgi:putative ABC transport system permease protein